MSEATPATSENLPPSETAVPVSTEGNIVDNNVIDSGADVPLTEPPASEEATNNSDNDAAPPETVLETEAAPSATASAEDPNTNQVAAQLEILKTNQEKAEELLQKILSEAQYAARFAEKKQEQIDKLYEENRQYKDDMVGKFKNKLVLGVIEQLDLADKQIRTFSEKEGGEKDYSKLFSAFTELADDFRDMLANRLEITPYKTEEGKPLDLKRHKIMKSEATGDKEKDKTIIRSARWGYENEDGKVLRPEFVDVYSYRGGVNLGGLGNLL